MDQHLLTIALFMLTFNGFSQMELSGVVLNAKDNSPLAFVAIGMINTSVGTISETDGTFSIKIPKQFINHGLIFSALGFERQTLSLKDLGSKTNVTVTLNEKIVVLNELTIESKGNFKKYEFGNREFDGGSMYAHTESAGSAMVMLVDNKHPHYSKFEFPAYLGKVSLRIINNTFGEFKLRLRMYAVDSLRGTPGKDLLEKDILVNNKIRNGWLDLDLLAYNITINEPFFIGFEWILERKDRTFLHNQYSDWYRKHAQLVTRDSVKVGSKVVEYSNFNGSLWAGTSFGSLGDPQRAPKFKGYFRYNSFGEWFVSPAALCMKIVMLN